jgi:hypothetical protein
MVRTYPAVSHRAFLGMTYWRGSAKDVLQDAQYHNYSGTNCHCQWLSGYWIIHAVELLEA